MGSIEYFKENKAVYILDEGTMPRPPQCGFYLQGLRINNGSPLFFLQVVDDDSLLGGDHWRPVCVENPVISVLALGRLWG